MNSIPGFGGFINKIWGRTEARPQEVVQMQTTTAPFQAQRASFIQEGYMKITPAQAGWIGRELGYTGNRKLAPVHVAKLAEYMRRGQWLDKSTLDFARLPTGQLTLVNGHHRMAAQAQTAKDVTWNVVFHDVADEDEIKSLYYRFDTEVRKRSAANIVQGVGLTEAHGVSRETGKALWAASQLIANDMTFRRYRQDQADILMDERLAVCADFAEPARQMELCINKSPGFLRAKLRTVSVFGLALVTFKHQPDAALRFWSGVCEDDGLSKGDPRKTMILDMQSRKGARGLVASHLMAGAKAWNAFLDGRDLKIIKVTGHSVSIDGTPYVVTT